MATPFSRTLRSLAAERSRPFLLTAVCASILLAAWSAWFFLASVGVHEISAQGRLEVDRAAHVVASEVIGRVTEVRFALGDAVHAGDLLLELDASAERARLEEERSRAEAQGAERAAIDAQLAAERQAIDEARRAVEVRLDEARALQEEAEVAASLAAEEVKRLEKVEESGLSELEILRARADAQRKSATARVARLAVLRIGREHEASETDRLAGIRELERERTQLDGQILTTEATVRRLAEEIEKRRIRAPVDGTIGEVTEVRRGSVVLEGEPLFAVIPHGKLRAVAEFPPSDALGRIRPGQHARIRFAGFPWSRFGTLPAIVSSVGSEPRDGAVRVELALDATAPTAVPLQHGLPLSAEVEVERLSPAELVLRAAGRLVAAAPRTADSTRGASEGTQSP